VKARKQGEESGIIRKEIPLRADKVMLVCPKCGEPTRVGHKLVHSDRKGKDVYARTCKKKKCGEILDKVN
jgi:large subunit ribosomal protein L24